VTPGMRRLAALAVAAAAASVLVACAPAAHSSPPTSTPREDSSVAPTGSAPSSKPTAAGKPTCEGIIPSTTVAAFKNVGWSSQEDPFQIGDQKLSGGIECRWADFSVASDNLQIFGWSPITKAEAQAARDALVSSGWHVLDGTTDGTYITEDKSTALSTDDEGYGMTYLFGDGWVKVADTKQGLLLVDWPPS
jgi:hypothetical protein